MTDNSDRIVSHKLELTLPLSSSRSKEIDEMSKNRISKDIIPQKVIGQEEQYQPAVLIDRIDASTISSSDLIYNGISKERQPVKSNVVNKPNRCCFQLSSSPVNIYMFLFTIYDKI